MRCHIKQLLIIKTHGLNVENSLTKSDAKQTVENSFKFLKRKKTCAFAETSPRLSATAKLRCTADCTRGKHCEHQNIKKKSKRESQTLGSLTPVAKQQERLICLAMLAMEARSRKQCGNTGVINSIPMLRLKSTDVENLTLLRV